VGELPQAAPAKRLAGAAVVESQAMDGRSGVGDAKELCRAGTFIGAAIRDDRMETWKVRPWIAVLVW
jgi:hypothetical protein